jgi:hypothetical protein
MKLAFVAVALVACMAGGQTIEVVQLGPTPRPGPWLTLRDALVSCAVDGGLTNRELRVRIEIDPDGGAGTVSASQGEPEYATCVGRTLGATRFPPERRGHTIEVPFAVAAR